MINIYKESGYLDIPKIKSFGMPFIFIVGGRGTGKTYGALDDNIKEETPFILMRRTQTQIDIISKDEFSPFKALNFDKNYDIGMEPITKSSYGIYHKVEVDGKAVAEGEPIGYTIALSTFSNLRGFDASDVQEMVWDEFIPETTERPIKDEASAFFNAVETINRNRELKGHPSVRVICLANSNNLANPIFMELGLVRKAEEMKKKGKEVSIMEEKGICLVVLKDSKISEMKKETALYKLTEGTKFSEMALGNNFSNEDVGRVKSRSIKEYKPIVAIGDICIYKHKSNREYYVSAHKMGSPVEFTKGNMDQARFRHQYPWLWREYIKDRIEFEDYLQEILFNHYMLGK